MILALMVALAISVRETSQKASSVASLVARSKDSPTLPEANCAPTFERLGRQTINYIKQRSTGIGEHFRLTILSVPLEVFEVTCAAGELIVIGELVDGLVRATGRLCFYLSVCPALLYDICKCNHR